MGSIILSPNELINMGFNVINSHKEWVKRNHVINKNDYKYPIYDHKNYNMYIYTDGITRCLFFNGSYLSINHIDTVEKFCKLFNYLTGKHLINFI